MEDDKKKDIFIFALITLSGVIYYAVNNAYDLWAINPTTNWAIALILYYTLSQPVYILFLYLIYERYQVRGLVAGIMLMVSFDIMSLPHSIASVMPGQNTLVPNDPNLSPYADWQLAHALSVNGVIGFWPLILIYIILPTALDFLALLIVSPAAYRELVASA